MTLPFRYEYMSIKLAPQTAMMVRLSCDRLTLDKALPGPEQFDIRANHDSAQWIAITPYFARNLTQLSAVCVSPLPALD
jgi:hypothetical protein